MRKLLEDAKPKHAVLVYRDRKLFLHITITKEVPEPEGSNPVGVDIVMKKPDLLIMLQPPVSFWSLILLL